MGKNITNWVNSHIMGLFLFNSIVMLLVLLNSAGYFHPFFIISINFIVIVSLILSIFLLGAGSRVMFAVAIFFWLLTMFFKITFVDIWAERSSIYAFDAFVIGVILLFCELIVEKKRDTLER